MARRDLTGAVDFAYLESYCGGDLTVVNEVLALFREQAEMWAKLLDEREAGWRDAVHTLKGSARGIGAVALADACAAAEAAPEGERAAALGGVSHALDLALADIAAYSHEEMLKGLRAE